jgi:hypothetical protein
VIAARPLAVAGLCAATIVVGGMMSRVATRPAYVSPAHPLALPERSHLRTGDLIFRAGLSDESQIVLHADSTSAYSHVGLVDVSDGGAAVIHIEPDDTERDSRIRREPLSVYLGPGRADAYALFHVEPADRGRGEAAVAAALRYRARGVSFDHAFDVESIDKMYCTELVWRAYADAGLDLLDGALDRRSLFRRRLVWLSALAHNRHVALADAGGVTR